MLSLVIAVAIVCELSIPNQAILQKALWILLAIVGIFVFIMRDRYNLVLNRMFLIANLAYAPFVIAAIGTVSMYFLVGDELNITIQAITTTIYLIVDMLAAYCLVSVFKTKSILIMIAAICLSYALSLFVGFLSVGLNGFILYLSGSNLISSVWFEKHDVGVSVVPLVIFLIFKFKEMGNSNKRICIAVLLALMLILFICGKRSALMGLCVGIFCFLIYRITRDERNRISVVFISAICVLIGSYAYVCIIHSGILGNIANYFAINSMGRIEVYEWFTDQYDITPVYFGKGFQYIHQYMNAGLGSELVNDFDYLHNSILQIYIETGFWGFWAWFIFILIIFPYSIKRYFGNRCYIFASTLMIVTVAIFMTDNVLTYPLYQLTLYVTLFAFIINKNSDARKHFTVSFVGCKSEKRFISII